MKKTKKTIISMLLSLMLLPTPISAQETTLAFYTNMNGAVLTEEQYDRLSQVFSEDTLYTMTPETIDLVKDETNLKKTEKESYIRIDTYYDNDGTLVDQVETEVSEAEALNFGDDEITTYSWNGTHQTNMKRLHMQVIANGYASQKVVTLTNTWLSIPSTKSYDVIALRPGSNSMTVNVSTSTISGYQKWDGNYVNYDKNSDNTKISSSFTGKGGIGISMNIVDSVTSSLENSMTVVFISGADPFKISGTYQHAQSNVTLSESKNYTFSDKGYGNVLDFASSVKSKYDQMQGIELSYSFGEELFG